MNQQQYILLARAWRPESCAARAHQKATSKLTRALRPAWKKLRPAPATDPKKQFPATSNFQRQFQQISTLPLN
ncbi:hypothetical protein A2U01_0060687 [Trifolium medium]|uniref:Uncharacterized protein n=1 Tax=Trifolium medium TaxID=97028 RepID=A0A392RV37_9FABA|nr:hypothetical protein [Trifolium medium]